VVDSYCPSKVRKKYFQFKTEGGGFPLWLSLSSGYRLPLRKGREVTSPAESEKGRLVRKRGTFFFTRREERRNPNGSSLTRKGPDSRCVRRIGEGDNPRRIIPQAMKPTVDRLIPGKKAAREGPAKGDVRREIPGFETCLFRLRKKLTSLATGDGALPNFLSFAGKTSRVFFTRGTTSKRSSI